MKNQRATREGSRGKAGRTSARIARVKAGPPQRSFGRRKSRRDGKFARGLRKIAVLFSFSRNRPMIALSAALFLFVGFAALFAGGYVGRSARAVERFSDETVANAGFGISEVRISGNSRTPPETVAAALGLAPGQSIFTADLGAARARLMALDWVADADVRRRYPDAINVHLVEKLPYALWKSPGGLFVVERSGGVITNKNLEPFANLPVLVGAGANVGGAEIVDQVAQHRAVAARVRAMERVSDRRWNLVLDDGVVVKLPEAGWQKELDTLDHLIIDKGILERDISEIDLRSPERFFFVLKSGEQKAEPRGRQI